MRRDRNEKSNNDSTSEVGAAVAAASSTAAVGSTGAGPQAPKNTAKSTIVGGGGGAPLTSYFFSNGDLVWIHPKKGYPLWPAEVQSMNSVTHIVECKLICPPTEALATCSAHANKIIYFDKYASQQQMDADVEQKLQRKHFDVSAFEETFKSAVRIATRLSSCPMTPSAVRRDMRFCVAPIGVVYSPFRSHCDAPRQPSTGAKQLERSAGVIRVDNALEPALQDLKGFERIWVMFHFSFSEVERQQQQEAADEEAEAETAKALAAPRQQQDEKKKDQKKKQPRVPASSKVPPLTGESGLFLNRPDRIEPSTAFNTRIVPPRDTKKRGVFATRTPHRPNFIGLSCVRLLDVKGAEVHITDHDLLHGTPVLDIKPYLPFCDSHPDAKAGWVDALNRSGNALGDHRPAGSTDYAVTRARGLSLEEVAAAEGRANKAAAALPANDDNDDDGR